MSCKRRIAACSYIYSVYYSLYAVSFILFVFSWTKNTEFSKPVSMRFNIHLSINFKQLYLKIVENGTENTSFSNSTSISHIFIKFNLSNSAVRSFRFRNSWKSDSMELCSKTKEFYIFIYTANYLTTKIY